MGYEARMDAESDYLAEHYQDCIEAEDIRNFIEGLNPKDNNDFIFICQLKVLIEAKYNAKN